MEEGDKVISWTSSIIETCAQVFVTNWCIFFSGLFIATIGFSVGIFMFQELTLTSKTISFLTGVTGACFVIYALISFKKRDYSEAQQCLELKQGKFHFNGREAGTLELSQAIRRDPEKLAQFFEPLVETNSSRPSSDNSGSSDCIFSNMFKKCPGRKMKLRDDDSESVVSNVSEITILEDSMDESL